MTHSTGRRSRTRGGAVNHDAPVPGSAADTPPDADPASVARNIVLRQLTAGARSRAQLADVLARRGVPDEVAQAVLDRFEEVDLVDDAEFARQWVQSRRTGRGLARRALQHELRHRGVDDETVREAVAGIDDDAEVETARELVRRRLPSTASDDPARRQRRLAGMLARKGYGPGVALRVVREEVAAAQDRGLFGGGDGDDLLDAALPDD